MADYIVRATAANGYVRAFAATTRDTVEYARSIHNTSPVATAALGRLLTAGAIMGSMMKNEKDVLTLQIKCDGPIKSLTVTADMYANVKGYVGNPNVIIPANDKGKLDVASALDLGVLSVIKDIGLKEPYIGQTILVTSEIAEDLTYYYATSEQTPSSVGLGVLMNKNNTVRQAGGFIIQIMPNASEEIITKIEEKLKNVESVTTLLNLGNTPEMLLNIILGDLELNILDKIDVNFKCDCDKHKIEKVLTSIGKMELDSMIADNEPIEVNCHFCSTSYIFEIDEIKELAEKI